MEIFLILLAILVIFLIAIGSTPKRGKTPPSPRPKQRYDSRGFDHNHIHINGTKYENDCFDYRGYNAEGYDREGYTIRGKDGNYIVSQPNGVTFDCSGMRSTFNQLKKTLIDSNTMTTANNPFDYIVDTARVDAVNGTFTFADESGNIVGLVTDGDYAITSSENLYPDLRVIIAAGDVTVYRNFKGLVICGGTIDIQGNVTMEADESLVIQAFNSFNTNDPTDRLASYLLHGANETLGDAVDPGDVDGWNLDTLVTYRNWTKN